MNVLKYTIRDEDIRNIEGGEAVLRNLLAGINTKETIFELDFSKIEDPVVSMSTGITFQNISNYGFPKIIVKNHKYKDKFKQNAIIKVLINRNQLEIE